MESAAWLLLDLADFMRQSKSSSVSEKAIQARLRTRINEQIRNQESTGDPLDLVETVRRLLAEQ
ncbi:MAG: hypothetical protein CMJ18_14605 [Phycisphaeraceae bacterium]|nr:hypothetical protein [Phycisphaeraceae bacterium]